MTTLALNHQRTADAAPNSQPIGLCLTCNYSLRGLPAARCPECGREFDPMDPAAAVNLATWAALLFALWFARLPGGQIRSSPSLLILIGLGLLWLAWPVLRVMAAAKYGWPHSLLMRGQKQRIAVGAALMLSSVAIIFALPFRATVALSRPAMDRLAQRTIASDKPYGDDQWVGLYPARRIKRVPGGMRFTVEERNRAYKSGFTYLPKVDPKRVGWSNKSYRYLGGGWWSWREEG